MVLWLSSVGLGDGSGSAVVESISVLVLVVGVKELDGVSSSDMGGSAVDSDCDSFSGCGKMKKLALTTTSVHLLVPNVELTGVQARSPATTGKACS